MHDLEEKNPSARRRKAEDAKRKLAEMPDLNYTNPTEQRLSFHLTFSCLKCNLILFRSHLHDVAYLQKFD